MAINIFRNDDIPLPLEKGVIIGCGYAGWIPGFSGMTMRWEQSTGDFGLAWFAAGKSRAGARRSQGARESLQSVRSNSPHPTLFKHPEFIQEIRIVIFGATFIANGR